MKYRTKKSGFTLIELLIVTVIIAILAALGLVAYSSSLQSARNSKRISDMNAVQASFEQYYTNNGQYDDDCTAMTASLNNNALPLEQKTGHTAYAYSCPDASNYCICAALEGGSVRGGNNDAASCSGLTTNGMGTHYCLSERQ